MFDSWENLVHYYDWDGHFCRYRQDENRTPLAERWDASLGEYVSVSPSALLRGGEMLDASSVAERLSLLRRHEA